MRKFVVIAVVCLFSSVANASEYCVDQYNDQITKVSAEAGALARRQAEIDKRIVEIYLQLTKLSADMALAAQKQPPDINLIQSLGKQIGDLNREKTELEAEGYKNQDRAVELKGVIPAELQGKLRGCIEATAPANNLVNLAIQMLAIYSTGGASLLLPPKTLYVDMSAVLNGYPTGGDHSIVNEAREAALKALPGGLGNRNNDFGKAVRDPGRIVRCWFGC